MFTKRVNQSGTTLIPFLKAMSNKLILNTFRSIYYEAPETLSEIGKIGPQKNQTPPDLMVLRPKDLRARLPC